MVPILDNDLAQELEYFDRLCQILDAVSRNPSQVWRPPTDIYETSAAVIVKLEIAGMNGEEFKISFMKNVLAVRGIRKDDEAKLNFHCMEIPYGKFQTRILIPGSYMEDCIQAKYENGYLYVILPKNGEVHSDIQQNANTTKKSTRKKTK